MFDIGILELVVIFVLALIVLGPERLPRVARTAGRWLSRARQMARNMQYELEREIDLEDMRARKASEPTPAEPPARDDDDVGPGDDADVKNAGAKLND